MAIVAPVPVTCTRGQTFTVTYTVPTDTTGWAMSSALRSHQGATAIATKTVGSGIVNTPGASSSTVVVTWSDTDTSQEPGAWVHDLKRTDVGLNYDIADPSMYLITVDGEGDYPTLTNLAALYSWVGLSPASISDTDARFYLLALSAAERTIRSLCGRDPSDGFLYKSRTEYPECCWTDKVRLQETPVAEITSVHYSAGLTWDTTTLLDSTAYALELDGTDGKATAGLLRLVDSVWAGGWDRPPGMLAARRVPRRYARVIYLGGYVTTPTDLMTAIAEIVMDRRQARLHGGQLQSESGENYNYSRGDPEKEAMKLLSVEQVVHKYRKGQSFVY